MAEENFTRIRNSVADGRRSTITPAGSPWRVDKMLVNHRRASITAKTDASSVSQRPCFLCASNRPPNQSSMPFGSAYEILINPFPLAEIHFTIPSVRHEPQILDPDGQRIMDMAHLAEDMAGLCVFFNGATCGASAPDHFHFQAVSPDAVPNIKNDDLTGAELLTFDHAAIYAADDTVVPYPVFIIQSTSGESLRQAFRRLWAALCLTATDQTDPPVNIALLHDPDNGITRTVIIPRRCHRPECYFYETDKMLISPATIEMLGTIVCSRPDDFDRLDMETAVNILREVAISPDDFKEIIRQLTHVTATDHVQEQMNL